MTDQNEKQCRICFCDEENEKLIIPCLCSGSLLYIHRSCLNTWRKTSPNVFFNCDICKYKYQFVNDKKPSLKYNKNGLYTNLSLMIMVSIIFSFCYYYLNDSQHWNNFKFKDELMFPFEYETIYPQVAVFYKKTGFFPKTYFNTDTNMNLEDINPQDGWVGIDKIRKKKSPDSKISKKDVNEEIQRLCTENVIDYDTGYVVKVYWAAFQLSFVIIGLILICMKILQIILRQVQDWVEGDFRNEIRRMRKLIPKVVIAWVYIPSSVCSSFMLFLFTNTIYNIILLFIRETKRGRHYSYDGPLDINLYEVVDRKVSAN